MENKVNASFVSKAIHFTILQQLQMLCNSPGVVFHTDLCLNNIYTQQD
jgi:hypothetical protein